MQTDHSFINHNSIEYSSVMEVQKEWLSTKKISKTVLSTIGGSKAVTSTLQKEEGGHFIKVLQTHGHGFMNNKMTQTIK